MLLTKNNAALRLLFEGGLLDHSRAEARRRTDSPVGAGRPSWKPFGASCERFPPLFSC